MIKVFECLSNSGNAEIFIERDYDSDGFHDDQYVYIAESEYDLFVTELEAKARELWPHKFEAYKLPDPKFVKVEMVGNKPYELKHFDDGSTAWVEQVLELNDVIKLDKELRQQQIPLNSKTK